MVDYKYIYIIGVFILLGLWLIFYLWRKDIRKEMIIMSIIFGFVGLMIEPIYVQDWWKPLTITNTPIGIEDFLFGFSIGGVASVIYEEVFKKKVKIRKAEEVKEGKRNLNFLFLMMLLACSFAISFYLLKYNSFTSSIIAFIIPSIVIYLKRKDLIMDSLMTGAILVSLVFIFYPLLNIISPGWIEHFWLFQNIGYITVLNIPLEEIVWYFLAGIFIGPLYEYWKEGKLINIKN